MLRLGVLVFCALVLRLAIVCSVGPPRTPVSDEIAYMFGREHAQLDTVWPRSLECRPPGYPLLLRALTLAGASRWGDLVVQALLSALTLVPLFAFGRDWMGERAALAACAIVAVYPSLIVYATIFMAETLFILLLVTAVALLARPEAGRAAVLGAGLTLAAAVLVRSSLKLLMPVSVAWVLVSPWWVRRERLVRAGLLALGLATPFALWTARNAAVYGEFIPSDCQSMYNLWQGNPPPGWKFMDVAGAYYAHSDSPTAREAFAREQALAAIRPAPVLWVFRKLATQVPVLVGPKHYTSLYLRAPRQWQMPRWLVSATTVLETVMWLVVAVAGVTGLVLAAPDPRRTLVLLLGVTTLALHVVAFALDRHRFPLVPFLALGTGLVLFRGPPAWAPSRGRLLAATIAVAVLLACAVAAAWPRLTPARHTSIGADTPVVLRALSPEHHCNDRQAPASKRRRGSGPSAKLRRPVPPPQRGAHQLGRRRFFPTSWHASRPCESSQVAVQRWAGAS